MNYLTLLQNARQNLRLLCRRGNAFIFHLLIIISYFLVEDSPTKFFSMKHYEWFCIFARCNPRNFFNSVLQFIKDTTLGKEYHDNSSIKVFKREIISFDSNQCHIYVESNYCKADVIICPPHNEEICGYFFC